ncbi:MAG TPA: Yip1 family protein [Gaiellaceae bacterium]|nr:Yip1 family protein [Gaiellaceae bacterium]
MAATDGQARPGVERDWWLRTLLVLQAPRSVFVQLRDDSDEAAEARQEPVTAIVLLAGVATVLGTTIAGRLLDDPALDPLVVAVWAIVGGGFYGLAGYFAIGALVLLGVGLAGSAGSYRRARHTLAFAGVPLALTLLLWPVRLSLYGTDVFRSGGADGRGDAVFDGLIALGVVWSTVLLVVGNRAIHAWSWPRALAATAVPALLPAFAYARYLGLA